jgi:hypothetical protein
MELFLAGALTGSHATQQRHLRQAKLIQAEIAKRWQRETPWGWQRKHLIWFLEHRMSQRSEAARLLRADSPAARSTPREAMGFQSMSWTIS